MLLELLKNNKNISEEVIAESHNWKSLADELLNSEIDKENLITKFTPEIENLKDSLVSFYRTHPEIFQQLNYSKELFERNVRKGFETLVNIAREAALLDAKSGKNNLGSGKIYDFVVNDNAKSISKLGSSEIARRFKEAFIGIENPNSYTGRLARPLYPGMRLNSRSKIRELFKKAYNEEWVSLENKQYGLVAADSYDRKTGVNAIRDTLSKTSADYDEVIDWITRHIEKIKISIPEQPKNESEEEQEKYSELINEVEELRDKYPDFKPIKLSGSWYPAWIAILDKDSLNDIPNGVSEWKVNKFTKNGLQEAPVFASNDGLHQITGNGIVKDLIYNLGFGMYLK